MLITFTNGYEVETVSAMCSALARAVYAQGGLVVRTCSETFLDPGVTVQFFDSTSGSDGALMTIASIDTSFVGAFDWYSIPFLLQALLVSCVAFAFMFGYRSGDKL